MGRSYFNLIGAAEHSVQVGDLGYQCKECPDFHQQMRRVNKDKHVTILGNHDDYGQRVYNALGDYGIHSIPLRQGTFDFFYVRGAWSIDHAGRLIGVSWWKEEQLTWPQGRACVEAYEAAKPRTVITHECPEEIMYLLAQVQGKAHLLFDFHPTTTHQILQDCFERHKPELWIFGHHHLNWRKEYKGTTFMCLDGQLPYGNHLMGYVDFDEDGHLLTPFPK